MLAREVSLSQATITGIIDRLVARQLVTRDRNESDRRQVTVELAAAGQALIETAPSPLQERFADRLSQLTQDERANISGTLNQIVQMMDGEQIHAAPVLSTSQAEGAEEDEAPPPRLPGSSE
jgi:DNA-binding MarR family transcriptional regulator